MTANPIIDRNQSTPASVQAMACFMATAYAEDGFDVLLISHDGKARAIGGAKARAVKSASVESALSMAKFMAQRKALRLVVVIDAQAVFHEGKALRPIHAHRIDSLVGELTEALGQCLRIVYIQE